MVELELRDLINRIQERKCEEQSIEVKAAHLGCPSKLYDTISAFANQNCGGTFVFGLDETAGFAKVGVYDAQDLQKRVMEFCEQMTPVIRPIFTVCNDSELAFVSAEIPPVDVADRPCFKTAKGRLQGSYTRVGDADKPMNEYEVYSYEAYRKKYQDDIRTIERVSVSALDQAKLEDYSTKRKLNRSNLSSLPPDQLYELIGITRNSQVTLSAVLLLSPYPQAYFPQLAVIATCIPGIEIGPLDASGQRFTDSKRIEGTLPEMLEGSLAFVKNNMRISTSIDPKTGMRTDVPQYPMDAVREAVLNALVHRDYSIHTEGMPIQLLMFSDRLEICNPGGLYGRLTIDQLGKTQPDTRNPVLVTAMEVLNQTENRYSGIPRIRKAMEESSLPAPVFTDQRGVFTVCLYNSFARPTASEPEATDIAKTVSDEKGLLAFCREPRSRDEIVAFLGLSSAQYALKHYLQPLIAAGAIKQSLPDKPRSSNQRFFVAKEYLDL